MSRFTLLSPASKSGRVYKAFKKDEQGVIERERETPGVYYKAEYRDFENFREMCTLLSEAEGDGNTCIVRGDLSVLMEAKAIGGLNVRRTKYQHKNEPAGFQPAVRDWAMIDVDKYEIPDDEFEALDPTAHPDECVAWLVSKLPHYFQDVSCWWQFSASQSVMTGSRTVSAHLFFMLDRTVSDVTMRRWAESQKMRKGSLPIDPVMFDSIQPHYIAPPRFVGMPDPLKVRSGVHEAERTRVIFDVPEESDPEFAEGGGQIHALVNIKKLKPYLDMIGDDPGKLGYNDAIKSVVGRYFGLYGYLASDLPLKTAIRGAIQDAPTKHDRPQQGPQSLEWYLSDEYLDPLIRNIRDKEHTSADAEANVYADALKRYVYVEDVERFLDMQTFGFRTKTGIMDGHAHEYDKLSETLLKDGNLRRVNRLTYYPGAPEFCEDTDPDTGKPFRAYNKYTPSPIKLQDPADGKWFLDHMAYICDGESEALDAILDWCAHLVQFPAQKINFGVLLQGMQGTGKSCLTLVMQRVLGMSNVAGEVTTQHIMSDFTEWMTNKQLLCCEEIRDQEDKFRIYNQMKHYITGPSLRVNPKGLPSYVVPNRANFLCYTQYEDAIPMDNDDRRFIIHFSQAVPQSEIYYVELFRRIEKYSGAVRAILERRDLTNFNPKGRAPMTSSKKEYLQMNGTPLERWLRESIDGEMFPCEVDLMTIRDLRSGMPPQFAKASDVAVTIALRKAGARKLPNAVRLPHGKTGVWVFRNYDKYETMSEKGLSDDYQQPVKDQTGNGYYQKPMGKGKQSDQKEF